MKRNGEYWNDADKAALKLARSFPELSTIALTVLNRMPQPIGQVCGPISTGGVGNLKKNIAIFDATISHLISQGYTIFDQVPFESHILRIIENELGARDNKKLLEEFYRPLFESRHVSRLYFIHNWESSEGANWEHNLAQQLGMDIVYLEPNLVAT